MLVLLLLPLSLLLNLCLRELRLYELVQLLIDRGAEVGARTSSNETSLHSAAEKNFVCGAQLLIEHGADVDASSIYGHRPLHFAVFNKSHDVVRLLVEHGANSDGIDLAGIRRYG